MPEPYRAPDGGIWKTREAYIADRDAQRDAALAAIEADRRAHRAALDAVFGPKTDDKTTSTDGQTVITTKEHPMKVTAEAIRTEALSLMRQHPTLSITDATKRAEEVLRIEANEPTITTFEQWQRASLDEQVAHQDAGFDVPRSPLQLLATDEDAFMAAYPDSPTTRDIVEARRWNNLTDEGRADEREGKALIRNLKVQHANLLDTAKANGVGPEAVVGLEVLITQSQASEGVREAARAVYDAEQAAAASQSGEPSIGDLRADVDNAFRAAMTGATVAEEV